MMCRQEVDSYFNQAMCIYIDIFVNFSSFSSNNAKQLIPVGNSKSQKSVLYDLYAVSNHSGTLNGGHYTAYCRHPNKTQNWNLCNDRSVSGANSDNIMTGEAYLLFFERKNT